MSKYSHGRGNEKPSYMHNQNRIRTRAPDVTIGFNGETRPGPKITLIKGTKPPPLRFKIGSYVRHGGYLYEIIYAYRVASRPHDWIYCLEVRKNLSGDVDAIGRIANAIGCGASTPRIVYDLFQTEYEANTYFHDIPSNGDRTLLSNKEMMKEAELVSSGQIVSSR